MATFSYTNLFSAGTPAVATQVNTNFNDVRTFAQGISTGTNIDGSAISEAKIATGAVSETKLATGSVTYSKLASSATQFLAPVGSITMYTGTTAPAGWLLCDGVTSTAGYTTLASMVGATTPNLQGRFPIGDNATLTLKGTGGSLTITQANLPSHTHTFAATLGHTVNEAAHSHIINSTDISHQHYNAAEGTTATAHTHNDTGNAGSINTGAGQTTGTDTTDGMTAGESHSHTSQGAVTGLTVNDHNLSGTTNGGTGSGTDYYPPYYVVNYIIKHD